MTFEELRKQAICLAHCMVFRPGRSGSVLASLAFSIILTGQASAQMPLASAPEVADEVAGEVAVKTLDLKEAQVLEGLRALVSQNRLGQALELINAVRNHIQDQVSLQFLEAHIARLQGRPKTAIRIYRGILHDHPGLVRVRLALASILFTDGQDRAAKFHYEMALAGDLPKLHQQLIKRNLGIIRDRQTWQIDFGASLTSNSNANGGPEETHVDLFGLPFELSDEARKNSQTGAVFWASGHWLAGDRDKTRLRSQASVWRTEHEGNSLDDMVVEMALGPQWDLYNQTIYLAATGSRRWFAGQEIQGTYGVNAQVEKRLSPVKTLSADFRYRKTDFANRTYDDGHEFSWGLTGTKLLSTMSRGQLMGQLAWHHANEAPWSWVQASVGARYMREFSSGLSLEGVARFSVRSYQAPHPGFGGDRRDLTSSLSLTSYRRSWSVAGFVPTVGYKYLQVASTLDFYSFDRHWMNLGIMRSF